MLLRLVIPGHIARHLRHRASSSTSTQPEAVLKSCLNAMYKLVHPDLFNSVEKQRAENERSLKLLQDYVSQARHGQNTDCALAPFRFVFYVKSPKGNKEDSSCSSTVGLRKPRDPPVSRVDLMLPPPPRNPTAEHISVGAQKALAKLMGAVGVPSDLLDMLLKETNTNQLRDFLPEAVEDIRQNEATALGSKARVATIGHALRLGRQVNVGFGQDCANLSAASQEKILKDLAWALDQAQDTDMGGLSLMVGEESGIDSNGRLWLDRRHSMEDWATRLASLDTHSMKVKAYESQKVQELERRAAKAAGLRMVYTSGMHQNDPAYTDFLQRIISTSIANGPVGDGQFSYVPLCVLPHSPDPPQTCSLNDDVGFVSGPMHLGPETIFCFIQANGQKLIAGMKKKEQQNKELLELQKRARLLLRVRRLEKSPQISLPQFRSCCSRLMKHAHSLSIHMDGVSLRVSTENKVSEDKTVINVAWDFKL